MTGGKWPLAVPCTGDDSGPGTVDIEALTKVVDFFSVKGHPIIVIFSYGTTSKGAYDDVKAAGEALVPILKKNGMYLAKAYLLSWHMCMCLAEIFYLRRLNAHKSFKLLPYQCCFISPSIP